jgi:hypothetical protein
VRSGKCSMPSKAELDSYAGSAFFKPDPSGLADLVVWAGDAMHQERLFWVLLPIIGDRIDYLFKEHVDCKGDEMLWRRVTGGIFRDDLSEVIRSDAELFFCDSGFQFCARTPDSNDYFAYDEHGLFWIYSKDPRYLTALQDQGLANSNSPLICDFAHWHVRPKGAEQRLESFIELLQTRSQFSEREQAEPDDLAGASSSNG